jgi:hypothetical protein
MSSAVIGAREFKERNMPWKPIETAPKDGTEVLVYGHEHYTIAQWSGSEWRDIGDIGWAGMDGTDNQPTHWMHLPKAPPAEGAATYGELLACASCGSSPNLIGERVTYGHGDVPTEWSIRCDCGLRTKGFAASWGDTDDQCKLKATEVWNRRAT